MSSYLLISGRTTTYVAGSEITLMEYSIRTRHNSTFRVHFVGVVHVSCIYEHRALVHRGIESLHAYSQLPTDFRPTRHRLVQITGEYHLLCFSSSACSDSGQRLEYVFRYSNMIINDSLITQFLAVDHPYFTVFILLCICIKPGIILRPLWLTGKAVLCICLLAWQFVTWPFKALGRFILYVLGFMRHGVERGTCLIRFNTGPFLPLTNRPCQIHLHHITSLITMEATCHRSSRTSSRMVPPTRV